MEVGRVYDSGRNGRKPIRNVVVQLNICLTDP